MPEHPEEDMAIVDRHVAALMEHFDSVQIFVTRRNPDGGTRTLHTGDGNWFARYGQARLWVTRQEARETVEAQREHEAE
jgi:hypothetical protein